MQEKKIVCRCIFCIEVHVASGRKHHRTNCESLQTQGWRESRDNLRILYSRGSWEKATKQSHFLLLVEEKVHLRVNRPFERARERQRRGICEEGVMVGWQVYIHMGRLH